MSVQIVTGYTGERHITPYMDATVNRSIFGDNGCILSTGSQMAASMPDINTFVIADGAFSIQGHIGITNGETLTVDTCATGSRRIDLVVARFNHNSSTNVDSMEIALVKGTETTSQYPTTPAINEGTISDGAQVVDMVLYKITMNGASVSISRVADISGGSEITQSYTGDGHRLQLKDSTPNEDVCYRATRTDTNVGVMMGVGSGGVNHGVWSDKLGKWIIYGDDQGVVRIPNGDVRFAGHSSSIGTYKNIWLPSAKTVASGKWYTMCSIVLEAGVWIIEAGARWDYDHSHNPPWAGHRVANISTVSSNTSYDICIGAPDDKAITQARWSYIVAPSANTRFYLNCAHGAGVNLNMPASGNGWGTFMRAVRIF